MKRSLIAVASLGMLVTLQLTSCSGNASSDSADGSEATVDTTLHITEIDMTVLNAARSYFVEDTSFIDSTFLAISAEVQWPKVIGKYDIKPLQEAIKSSCFGEVTSPSVNEAVIEYVSDYKMAGLEQTAVFTSIDRVAPISPSSYSISLTGRFLDFGKRLLTYEIEKDSYLGGGHPNTISRIFSYDLDKGKVITIDDLIQPDKMALFTIGVKKQLADQTGMTIAELNQNLQVREFIVSNDVYCADGMIYVHYNPYEILPYSMGTINVEMSPFEYASILTPYARQLLLD